MKQIKKQIKKTQKKIQNSYTVNSNKKSLNTVNSRTVEEEIEDLLNRRNITPEGVGKLLAEGLDDKESEAYYFLLAKENKQAKLLEAMHLTKEAYRHRKIRTKKAIYFIAILRNWGFKTKFKND